MRASRRRRLILYSAAFATMLALSSVLDVRRATLRDRHAKLQLTLPSGTSLSSVSDASAHANSGGSVSLRPHPPHPDNRHPQHPPPPPPPSSQQQRLQQPSGVQLRPPPASDSDSSGHERNLTDQELKDDVDQLIAHVDEENAAAASTADNSTASATSSGSATTRAENTDTATSAGALTGGVLSHNVSATDPGMAVNAGSANVTDAAPVRLNSEQNFDEAKRRLQLLLTDPQTKALIDDNDLRTLQALELQATRGDCEQKPVAQGGSLFKTDAEAASNVDIERTDPLWGAWCLFTGSYKTDAMRDYVQKQTFLENKLSAARLAAAQNQTNDDDSAATFDPNAATLDDVLTPEQQSELRLKTDRIMAHLRENDVRYLAALSLQATFGDCGPYGKEADAPAVTAVDGDRVELRVLKEPLLDQTVTRKQGAQWGAWCVLQGKQRSLAATELSNRLHLLVEQLSKTEAETEEDKEESTDAAERNDES